MGDFRGNIPAAWNENPVKVHIYRIWRLTGRLCLVYNKKKDDFFRLIIRKIYEFKGE